MQPLAYFAVRSLLGWLQWVERAEHAFERNAMLLVATGAAHCWAVVYALFIAIHTRAMRYDGYHEGYTEHLPFWVSWTETLAVSSMGVWWAAGFSTAAIRIIDDDARGLPMGEGDVQVNWFYKLLRAQRLHDGLALAHTLSCIGLFASIIFLCIAMGLMQGSVTACELCLCFVAVGFAMPHAVVAARRLDMSNPKKVEDVVAAPSEAAEAAAQEAASLGPQLCVILALADSPGHAYLWQNFVYFVSAIAFVAAIAACGRSPPKMGNAALPPETGEFATCLLLDIAASVALVVCFPHLNTWHLWALSALLVALFVAVWFEGWRGLFIELLEPLFVVRAENDKVLPGRQRETLRKGSWVCCLACAAVSIWDIMLHPVQEGLFELPDDLHGLDDGLADLWDQNTMMLFRWKPGEGRGEPALLWAAAESLGIDAFTLKQQVFLEEHRLMLFKYDAGKDAARPPAGSQPMHAKWKANLQNPKGELAKIADSDFPAVLNVTLCLHAHANAEIAKHKAEKSEKGASPEESSSEPSLPEDFVQIVGSSEDAHAAYLAGCQWWTETLDSFYGHPGNLSELESDAVEHSENADEEEAGDILADLS
eukprot:TRINITY_DN15827_c0_g1_i1.p1 TRINITY_DN15827_c0_g1~~TRINITY_DN15827_c0_g1_i1.p1  ORF type:complete len:595 (+),score=148.12 TRINITY_DN15827_c0_g1_i1:81-1865(+)